MKYLQLLLIFCFTDFSAEAQQYVPFPTKDAVWKQYKEFLYEELKPHGWSMTRQYKIERDTIIKGTTYHLLSFIEWMKTYNQYGDAQDYKYSKAYPGALREDSNKRVYFYDFKKRKDTLLYDFNIDKYSLPKTYLNNYEYNVLGEVDSVLLNGKYHRRYGIVDWKGHGNKPYTYLIEGIGNIDGLFTEVAPHRSQPMTELICFSVNGETIYKKNDSVDCSLVTSVRETKKKNVQFNIYPNPTSGQFNIKTQSIFGEGYICVRDVLGRVVQQEKLQSPNQTFNISKQPKGLYFVEIRNGNQKAVQKLILQ